MVSGGTPCRKASDATTALLRAAASIVVMAWAIDRLGRSLIDLLGAIQTLEACGVDLYLE